MKTFNIFGFFFKKNNKKKNLKNKTTKNKNKKCPQTIERIKSGTSKITLTLENLFSPIAQVFGFVGENP